MPSQSLQHWESVAAAALDEIQQAHAAVGGIARGRRYTTRQVNQSYVVLLSSHFQAFCRNLHTEAVDHLVRGVAPASLRRVLRADLTLARKLDHGNPNPGNLGADFGRLGMRFWTEVRAADQRNQRRQQDLKNLNDWRNAIAHQDFPPTLKPPKLRLADVRRWRSVCGALAVHFDRVVANHLLAVVGSRPW